MLELVTKVNKIQLEDYDYKKDLENRAFLSKLTAFDLEVLEEILYSSLQIPIEKLAKNLNTTKEKISPVLTKFFSAGLLSFFQNDVLVDKKMRKFFEFQILKFNEDFKANLEVVQNLLKALPIHILPSWYHIPRTSNNIFLSIVEKYLHSPQIYQRYLTELKLSDPLFKKIITEMYAAPDFTVKVEDIQKKHKIDPSLLQETILLLEYNFAAFLSYVKEDGVWKEVLSPLYEYKEYLLFTKKTEPKTIKSEKEIQAFLSQDFCVVNDMNAILQHIKKTPISINTTSLTKADTTLLQKICGKKLTEKDTLNYFQALIQKMLLLKFIALEGKTIKATDAACQWMSANIEIQALHLQCHPYNRILSQNVPATLNNEKYIKEIQKEILRVTNKGWIYFEDFFKGVTVAFNEEKQLSLKQSGKNWSYWIPTYSEEEKKMVYAVIFEILFESGVVFIGKIKNADCFCVTPFGKKIFEG